MDVSRVDAITFDFWNTLCEAEGEAAVRRRRDAWQSFLAEFGLGPYSDEDVEAAGRAGWRLFDRHWLAGEPPRTEVVVAEMVRSLLGTDHLRLTTVVSEWIEAGPPPGVIPLAPGVDAALAAISDAGIRIGIICDVGLTPGRGLRGVLEGHGILDRFDHWSFSDEVGVFKPSPVIFDHAAAGLGVSADRLAHIGDLRRTDVAGARGAGWLALRYSGLFDDPGDPAHGTDSIEADHVVADHADLPGVLAG